jgi:hypothetical protein
MTANRWIAANLTAVTGVFSVCHYAVVAAPAVSEDVGIGPPPALAPGQAPPLPKAGPLAQQRAALPITNSFEMGSASIGDAVSKIAGDKD